MSAATLPRPRGFAVAWTKDPIDIEKWRRAARRAWRWFKLPRRQGRAEHFERDWEIARGIGDAEGGLAPSRRTIQRGLWWLENVLGAIVRDWSGGHGRVIRITLPLAGDDAEKPGKTKAKPAKTRPAPAPAAAHPAPVEPPAEETAEERAAAAAALRDAAEKAKAHRASERAAEKAAAAGPQLVGDQVEKAARALTDEEFGRLEGLEARGEITSTERKVLDAARRIRSP